MTDASTSENLSPELSAAIESCSVDGTGSKDQQDKDTPIDSSLSVDVGVGIDVAGVDTKEKRALATAGIPVTEIDPNVNYTQLHIQAIPTQKGVVAVAKNLGLSESSLYL